VAFVAATVLYKSSHNNYTYMKMYIFHLPLLSLIYWGSVQGLFENGKSKFLTRTTNWAYLFIAILTVSSGLIYIIQYKSQSSIIDKNRIAFHKEARNIALNNVVLFTPFQVTHRMMYSSILSVPWIDTYQWNKLVFQNYLPYKVYLFIEKQPGFIYGCNTEDIIFENQDYLIIDSGTKVMDGLTNEGDMMNFETFMSRVPSEISLDKQGHNLNEGLPIDFDSYLYLRLNPKIMELFNSDGTIEKGEALVKRAEMHYKSQGSKEELRYK